MIRALRRMYRHHQQATTMGLLVLPLTDDPGISTLAHEITSGQAEEMGMMLEWSRANDVPPVDDTWRSMAWMSPSSRQQHGHTAQAVARWEYQTRLMTQLLADRGASPLNVPSSAIEKPLG